VTPHRAVEAVDARTLHDLRRAVLRTGTPSDDVEFPGDDDPATVHLAICDEQGTPIAAATWLSHESPDAAGAAALQLRGMAVAAPWRGRGLGALLLAAGVALARERGADVVWANARDTALGFYRAHGFEVVGDGFMTTDTCLPHHRVLRRL